MTMYVVNAASHDALTSSQLRPFFCPHEGLNKWRNYCRYPRSERGRCGETSIQEAVIFAEDEAAHTIKQRAMSTHLESTDQMPQSEGNRARAIELAKLFPGLVYDSELLGAFATQLYQDGHISETVIPQLLTLVHCVYSMVNDPIMYLPVTEQTLICVFAFIIKPSHVSEDRLLPGSVMTGAEFRQRIWQNVVYLSHTRSKITAIIRFLGIIADTVNDYRLVVDRELDSTRFRLGVSSFLDHSARASFPDQEEDHESLGTWAVQAEACTTMLQRITDMTIPAVRMLDKVNEEEIRQHRHETLFPGESREERGLRESREDLAAARAAGRVVRYVRPQSE